MKPRALVACVAVVSLAAASAVVAQIDGSKHEVRIDLDHPQPEPSAPAKPATPKPAPAPAAAKSAASPGPASAATPAPAATGDQAAPKIDGMEVARSGGGFLGVKVEGNTWKITFYDKDKKPVAADVASIVLRWPVHYQRNDERAELLPSADGMAMVSPKVVRPPFTFKLFMTLLKDPTGTSDVAPEMYVIDFQQ